MNLTNFKWDQDADGIVTLTWDVPDRSMNVLTTSAIAEIAQVAGKIAGDDTIKGVVFYFVLIIPFCFLMERMLFLEQEVLPELR